MRKYYAIYAKVAIDNATDKTKKGEIVQRGDCPEECVVMQLDGWDPELYDIVSRTEGPYSDINEIIDDDGEAQQQTEEAAAARAQQVEDARKLPSGSISREKRILRMLKLIKSTLNFDFGPDNEWLDNEDTDPEA